MRYTELSPTRFKSFCVQALIAGNGCQLPHRGVRKSETRGRRLALPSEHQIARLLGYSNGGGIDHRLRDSGVH